MEFRANKDAGRGSVADMHTHSKSSHDSVCEIEEMRDAQLAKGTTIFAVTDHFDTCSYAEYDVFTPIRQAYETVRQLNDEADGACRILAGIEIGESFRHPEFYEKVRDLVPYDVVIGSVHLVEHHGKLEAYSRTDFSAFSAGEIIEYLNRYLDDMLTMIDFLDLDILAHLTCPLRYITGKYGIRVDLAPFEDKIRLILRKIIEKGIALEVNTSALDRMGELMPPVDMIKSYYNMGGRLVTLGSDAHTPDRASVCFEEALACLREIGFDAVYYYQNRQPRPISILQTEKTPAYI